MSMRLARLLSNRPCVSAPPGRWSRRRRESGKCFFPGKQTISLRDALQSYPGPTRIVFGVEDRIIPAAQASGLPGAVALHFFPGVAHMPHFEARAEVAQIVEDNVAAGERRRA